ncbi:hypothetical protein FB451DRAFT_1567953 [Mycena latifolia]|nr:hypothetical protein FB451DRAFT_1567953 [Mycena latifolia]
MRLFSAIYISILSLTAIAAPLTHPSRGDAPEIKEMARQDHDTPVLVARGGSDVFEELDIIARDPDVEVEVERRGEDPDERDPWSGGCVIG